VETCAAESCSPALEVSPELAPASPFHFGLASIDKRIEQQFDLVSSSLLKKAN
jgi:hypothetical protein